MGLTNIKLPMNRQEKRGVWFLKYNIQDSEGSSKLPDFFAKIATVAQTLFDFAKDLRGEIR